MSRSAISVLRASNVPIREGSDDWEKNLQECQEKCYQQSVNSPVPPDQSSGLVGCWYR